MSDGSKAASAAAAGSKYNEISSIGDEFNVPQILGDAVMAEQWTVFAPLDREDPLPEPELLADIPESLKLGATIIHGQQVEAPRNQYRFGQWFGPAPDCLQKTAYVFVELQASAPGVATLGVGGDHWLQAWLNGALVLGKEDAPVANHQYPPGMAHQLFNVHLRAGRNVLAVRFVGGKAENAQLLIGGPRDLRGGDFYELPFDSDPRWSQAALRAAPGNKQTVQLGARRELFVDDHMIDCLTGTAERRLHHPRPANIALLFDQPWEAALCRYFTILRDHGNYHLYHLAKSGHDALNKDACQTCLAVSNDGIVFERRMLHLHAFKGSTDNNILLTGRSSHNFAPFIDTNPAAPPDERYKAVADYPGGGGLGVFVSPDGIRWRLKVDQPVMTKGAFDSQNLAFWDAQLGKYRAYYRQFRRYAPKREPARDIMTCTSDDFVCWSEPEFLEYADKRMEHLYTNCIQPYPRAPHIYIGTPLRYLPCRNKIATHYRAGLGEAILMSSRDGRRFERWENAFIRPGLAPGAWTDRKHEPAWGMVQTSPAELSIYWWDYDLAAGRHMLRRGTLRTDGFASLHAPGRDVGEMLTRPFVFDGRHLDVNYATAAAGTMMFELCDEAGTAIDGYALEQSEALYGNELTHMVEWRRQGTDVRALAGRVVRLRVRLHDADLYSWRFV
ncbi:MAG: hypothetical protein ABR497_06380 [Kiritimatiellia bacterium]